MTSAGAADVPQQPDGFEVPFGSLMFICEKTARMLMLQPWIYVLAALYFTEQDPLCFTLPLHLLTLFIAAMVFHGELVRRRPVVEHLTEFYLWMSVGGLLGGVFCSLIAPVVFNSIFEYPLVLALGCLLLPSSGRGWLRYGLDIALPSDEFPV